MTPEIKSMVKEAQQYIEAHRARDKILRSQLSTADLGKKPQAVAIQAVELPLAKKTAIKPSLDKLVGFKGDALKTTQYVKFLKDKGVPEDEMNYLLSTAKQLVYGNPAQPLPQVPQGR